MSSLYLVYDTYYPILENNNVGVIGITAAMAWELPSEPLHIDEVLQGAYEEGDLPLLNRNDEIDSNYTADTTTGQPAYMPSRYYNYNSNNTDRYYNSVNSTNSARQDYYYYMKETKNDDNKISRRPVQPENLYYSSYKAPNLYNTQQTYQNDNSITQKQPIPTVIDQISNKMDYYFSYADKMLNTIYDTGSKKYMPWQQARWGQQKERYLLNLFSVQ